MFYDCTHNLMLTTSPSNIKGIKFKFSLISYKKICNFIQVKMSNITYFSLYKLRLIKHITFAIV